MKIKLLVLCLGLLIGGFLFAEKSFAYSQTSANGYLHFEQSGSYRLLWNDTVADTIISNSSANNGVGFIATSSLGTFGTITDISASFKNHGTATSTIYAVVSCVDGTGTHTITTSNQSLGGSATTFENLTFSFSLTCNSSTMTQVQVNFFSTGWQSNDLQIQADNSALSAGKGITYYQPSPGNDAFNQSYMLRIAVNSGGFPINPDISFKTPAFTEGMTTPDFKNWFVCMNIPAPHTLTAFDFSVDYGTSTPNLHRDLFSDDFGQNLVPLPSTKNLSNNCLLLTKSASTTPGTYVAIATLFDENNATITQSSLLNFSITNGNVVPLPNNDIGNLFQAPKLAVVPCGPTDFSINFGVGAVDFGQGLCNTARFLFVPPDGVSNLFSELAEENKTKIPISYFYEMKTIVDGVASGTPASLPAVKIQTSATSSIPNLNIEIFSTSTIAAATSRGGFSGLRTVANVVLWVAWGFLMLQTGLHLFKRKEM